MITIYIGIKKTHLEYQDYTEFFGQYMGPDWKVMGRGSMECQNIHQIIAEAIILLLGENMATLGQCNILVILFLYRETGQQCILYRLQIILYFR